MSNITLYPSNWLYNAGVIGLLQSAEDIEKIEVKGMLAPDGSLSLELPFFSKLSTDDRYFGGNKISSIVGRSHLYRNFLQARQKDLFIEFVKALDAVVEDRCNICGKGWSLDRTTVNHLNQKDPGRAKFLDRIKSFSIIHYSNLGPSIGKFPNAFWSLSQSATVCHLCSFVIIHHHLALTRLSDGSEIFINAPSFKVMYYLNKFAQEVFGALSSEEMRTKRNILAMSVIEYATKIQTTLGLWTGMNIEVVSKYRVKRNDKREDVIDFFSLPYEVIELLSDRRIAALLSQIGEFQILNHVLKQDFSRLMEMGYRLLRIGLKRDNERAKSERDFLDQKLQLDKNRQNPAGVAEKIFQLCALVEEKRKRRLSYEYARVG